MPSQLSSSFASAAAGNNHESPNNRGGGVADWPRRANGAIQTFRRSSLVASNSTSSHQREVSGGQNANSAQSSGVYVPPHVNAARNGNVQEHRYSREQLLDIMRNMSAGASSDKGVSDLLAGEWEPSLKNGFGGGWGRKEEHVREGVSGLELCWDHGGNGQPLAWTEMTEGEKELFSTSVISPLKAPIQNQNKEGTIRDSISLRKTSLSLGQGSPSAFGLSSPTSSKPQSRRRETSDSIHYLNSSLASPGGGSGRYLREDPSIITPPPALLRRRTAVKDFEQDPPSDERSKETARDEALSSTASLVNLKRSTTGPYSSGLVGSSSPWASTPQSAGFSDMGPFGSFALGSGIGQSSMSSEKRPGLGGLRSESKFKGLMSRDGIDEVQPELGDNPSMSSLSKIKEVHTERHRPPWMEVRADRPTSKDTDPYPDANYQTGSAALGGGEDTSLAQRHATGVFDIINRQGTRDEMAFAAFGMRPDAVGFRNLVQQQENDVTQHQTPQRPQHGPHEPMSPTDTNPYQSPSQDDGEVDVTADDEEEIHNTPLPGLGAFGAGTKPSSSNAPLGRLSMSDRATAGYDAAASDRSQTSSTSANKGFPSLGGLGGLSGQGANSGWPPTQTSVGTPGKERAGFSSGFGDFFPTSLDLQSPTLAGLANSNIFGPGSIGGSGLMGRTSKMGSLFPAEMQEDMRVKEQSRQRSDANSVESIIRLQSGAATLGRNPLGPNVQMSAATGRETDSPFRSSRGLLDDFSSKAEASNQRPRDPDVPYLPNEPPSSTFGHPQLSSTQQTSMYAVSKHGPPGQSQQMPSQFGQRQSLSAGSSASNQPPAAQQRTMVMPDRMRWIYRDPQGNTQGPWSGLEMHDWYRAGFFSPELLVKKYEDPDYEPLAQLIRRIGNSREPFLVPQIGIPHGPATTQAGNAWAGQSAGVSAIGTGSQAQPPFASSFPSFGTTLTAEQQNALERRKQEEQYLMARQKEHLAQQQVLVKQMQMQGQHGINSLQHQASTHSLHSQPSFGSITSPTAFQPSPHQGPLQSPVIQGFFDNSFRGPGANIGSLNAGADLLGNIREEDMPALLEQLNLGRGAQAPFVGAPGAHSFQQQQQQMHQDVSLTSSRVSQMLNDRAQLQRDQEDYDALQRSVQDEQQGPNNRLNEFLNMRAQLEEEKPASPPEGVIGKPVGALTDRRPKHQPAPGVLTGLEAAALVNQEGKHTQAPQVEPLSLAEQVQKAASAAASAKQSPAALTQSPWAKLDPSLPLPFPPPQSFSPLPAPAAQRNRQNVADALAAESRSRPASPAVEAQSASLAPWAKEPAEALKGPSLKEIQEAEARKAAQAEELAAAARRAALERELAIQALAPAPGLPSSSTWGISATPSMPSGSSAASAWAKPLAGKPAVASPAGDKKKTLMQIQKEEEARKARAAAVAATNNAPNASNGIVQGPPAGKRYADLAGKVASPPTNVGGAWTTVGASGKVKAPSIPTPSTPQMKSAIGAAPSSPAIAKPKTPGVAGKENTMAGQANAREEFRKWAIEELRPDLKGDIKVDEFVQGLLNLPPDIEIITEAVHEYSRTLDSRHFADEFIKRKKLADKGLLSAGAASGGARRGSPAAQSGGEGKGGWSEVAKKGPAATQEREMGAPGFKIVAKKKGAKR